MLEISKVGVRSFRRYMISLRGWNELWISWMKDRLDHTSTHQERTSLTRKSIRDGYDDRASLFIPAPKIGWLGLRDQGADGQPIAASIGKIGNAGQRKSRHSRFAPGISRGALQCPCKPLI